jgi:hypothetical protein
MRERSSVLRPFATATVATIIGLSPAAAGADMTKLQCIDANTRAQDLRRDGKLGAAREQLRQCADATCPEMVRDDCTRRLDEVERAQPTIVFEAKDGSGNDQSDVKVTVDGAPLADRLDGAALRVDPGQHVFVFLVAGQPPLRRTLVLAEGDKGRREKVVLGSAPPPPQASPVAAPPTAQASVAPASTPWSTQRALGATAAGAGVAGLALGSVFGLMTISEANKQSTDCASAANCANRPQALNDHSNATTDGIVATVAFAAGGGLLALGAVLFFTGGHASEPASAARLLVVPSVSRDGGAMSLSGAF